MTGRVGAVTSARGSDACAWKRDSLCWLSGWRFLWPACCCGYPGSIPWPTMAFSLMVAFSAGLWNLSGDGQFMLGAVLASAVAPALLSRSVPLEITLFLALLAGALGGMLWGPAAGDIKHLA
ncbi:hypothetical protein D8L93_09515 [Sodalis-like symbiont of Bactericera trigonica]|nr:hypothetical protein D8L93_09515 [Sodalis-like symbiont of Bactericera trigonica]